jgi:hypothetical protein
LFELGEPWWKSAIIAVLVFVCCHVALAPRWLMRCGLVLGAVASLVWLSVLPAPQMWPQLVNGFSLTVTLNSPR